MSLRGLSKRELEELRKKEEEEAAAHVRKNIRKHYLKNTLILKF